MRAVLFFLLALTAHAQFGTPADLTFGRVTASLTDWATRVVANGGAMPSANTVNAMEDFRVGIIADGLSNKMLSVCVFVPDSLIAATTPIFKAQGYDPWTNHNFSVTNLTVEGLNGDGTSKYLDTGVHANSGGAYNAATGNVGLSVIISELGGISSTVGSVSSVLIGHNTSTTSLIWLCSGVTVNAIFGTTAFCTATTGVSNTTYTNDIGRCGFVSGNSLGNATAIYVQSPIVAQRTLATNSVVSVPTSSTTDTIFAFANAAGTTPNLYSSSRISVVAIHDGLTAAEAALFANRLFTLRTALGGGTGDEVTDWAAKVVRYGGAVPSGATKTALRTAYTSLNAAGLLTNSAALNFFAPDNLIATRTPLVWQAGSECWTNVAFGETNLSVNGLTGDGTNKYLKTGIVGSTIAANTGFNINSAGVHLMIVTNKGGVNNVAFGAVDSVGANSLWGVGETPIVYYCWGYAATSGYVSYTTPAPGATWAGFLSANRTANTTLAIYRANTGLTFGLGANGTGVARDATGVPDTQAYAFALNNRGTTANWDPDTISFIGLTAGLTSVQSSNLYYIVSTARAAMGGGNP